MNKETKQSIKFWIRIGVLTIGSFIVLISMMPAMDEIQVYVFQFLILAIPIFGYLYQNVRNDMEQNAREEYENFLESEKYKLSNQVTDSDTKDSEKT